MGRLFCEVGGGGLGVGTKDMGRLSCKVGPASFDGCLGVLRGAALAGVELTGGPLRRRCAAAAPLGHATRLPGPVTPECTPSTPTRLPNPNLPKVGEAYLPLILTATPEVQPPVEAMLEVVAHPDAEIYSMAFPFW
jgi:hypothetical protein